MKNNNKKSSRSTAMPQGTNKIDQDNYITNLPKPQPFRPGVGLFKDPPTRAGKAKAEKEFDEYQKKRIRSWQHTQDNARIQNKEGGK